MTVSIFFLLFTILNILNCVVLNANGVDGWVYWTSVLALNGAYVCGCLRQLSKEVE